jgi:hypothetical protein
MDATSFNYVLTQFGVAGIVLVVMLLALYKLGADLARLRTDLQQQLTRDLLNKRFDAYGRLWAEMQPLAAYSDDLLSPPKAAQLNEALSAWYFSAAGGMFLTTRAREFYFSLQDMLQAASELKGWKCSHRPDDPKAVFRRFLAESLGKSNPVIVFDPASLDQPEAIDEKLWRDVCRVAAQGLKSLPATGGPEVSAKVFTAVQQVSSALRSVLADELQTRLELHVPRP